MNSAGLDKPDWASLNEKGFSYFMEEESSEALYYHKNNRISTEEAYSLGFPSSYARTSWTNDVSEVAELVMGRPKEAIRAAKRSLVLKSKVIFIIDYLQEQGCHGCGEEVIRQL